MGVLSGMALASTISFLNTPPLSEVLMVAHLGVGWGLNTCERPLWVQPTSFLHRAQPNYTGIMIVYCTGCRLLSETLGLQTAPTRLSLKWLLLTHLEL